MSTPFPKRKIEKIVEKVLADDIEYETLHRIPASEIYEHGTKVGFVTAKGWLVAVNWNEDGEIVNPQFAIEPGTRGALPGATKWMLADNQAVENELPISVMKSDDKDE